jgi:hypothetical protein
MEELEQKRIHKLFFVTSDKGWAINKASYAELVFLPGLGYSAQIHSAGYGYWVTFETAADLPEDAIQRIREQIKPDQVEFNQRYQEEEG